MRTRNPTPECMREPGTKRVWFVSCWSVLGALFLVLLSGCLLVSGEQTSVDLQPGGGNLSVSFVSAEGQTTHELKVSEEERLMRVIAIVEVESGDLRLELLRPNGAVEFVAEGRPDSQVTRTSHIQTDEQGYIRYRVSAQAARNGTYQLLFQE
ncbi:MAG: hypothetical protein ACLFVO_26785 [Chloroflexaceae bacterium]